MKWLTQVFTMLFFSLLLFSCKAQTKTGLTASEFENDLKSKDSVQLLDVRTPGEYNSGHIKNSLQADWNDQKEFERRISFVDKNKPVYVYCLAGGRSAAAALKMRKMGFNNVYELLGGINAWKAASKELEGKTTENQMSIEAFTTLINSNKIVLVDFGAAWCPPCKLMDPIIKNLETKNPGMFVTVKVNGGNDQDIMQQYHVTALPVFIVFKDGKLVWRKDGITDEKELMGQLR